MFKIKTYMIQELVDIFRNISLRHKGVRTFRYNGEDLINAQNSHAYYQVTLDDVQLHELNITTNIFTVNLDIYILGFGHDTARVQDNAYTIAVDMIAWLDNHYIGSVSVHDYSILTLSRFTDDEAAGVKISLELAMPSPLDLCTYEDNFNDEPYEPEPDHEIDVPEEEVGDLDINVIKLPRDANC